MVDERTLTMQKIEDLYKERDTLTRWLILACIFFFIPGIALGLTIQIRNVDQKIRIEFNKLKALPLPVVFLEKSTSNEEVKKTA